MNEERHYYGLHGKLIAKKGHGDTLAAILIEASELVSQAEGCRLYIVSRDHGRREAVWVTEVWDRKEDHDRSLEHEDVQKLIARALPVVAESPGKGQELDVLGGVGMRAD